jgi:hypothetical protein
MVSYEARAHFKIHIAGEGWLLKTYSFSVDNDTFRLPMLRHSKLIGFYH